MIYRLHQKKAQFNLHGSQQQSIAISSINVNESIWQYECEHEYTYENIQALGHKDMMICGYDNLTIWEH